MAEVLGIVSAVQATTQLIEQAFLIIGRLRRAHQRQKGLVDVLTRHESELDGVRSIIDIIEKVEELRTESIGMELARLKEVQSKLAAHLEELDPKPKGKVSQFTRQLVHGSTDERKLCEIMDELVHVKQMLLLRIQVADVGVIRTMGKLMFANAEAIQRVDALVREQIENFKGLRIAKLVKNRRPSNDGTVPLTADDLRLLNSADSDEDSSDETLVDESEMPRRKTAIKTVRVIERNKVRQQALQINAAWGDDIWAQINRIEVNDNIAEDQGLQINHGTSFEVGLKLIEIQDKRLALKQQQIA